MKKWFSGLLLFLFIFPVIITPVSAVGQIHENREDRPLDKVEDISSVFGLLKGMTFNPSYVQIEKGNFLWSPSVTKFADEKNKEMTPRSFLKAYINMGVRIVLNSDKVIVSAEPVNY